MNINDFYCYQEGKQNPAFVSDDGLTRIDLGKTRNGPEAYGFAYGAEDDRKTRTTASTEQMVDHSRFNKKKIINKC